MVNVDRAKETDLILPALRLIARFGDSELGLETSVLQKKLRSMLVPSAEDLEILAGRRDDRLSQVIRNLVSHRTLEKKGLAVYRRGTAFVRGSYVLTSLGQTFLSASSDRDGSSEDSE
jgi:hypothetical protein